MRALCIRIAQSRPDVFDYEYTANRRLPSSAKVAHFEPHGVNARAPCSPLLAHFLPRHRPDASQEPTSLSSRAKIQRHGTITNPKNLRTGQRCRRLVGELPPQDHSAICAESRRQDGGLLSPTCLWPMCTAGRGETQQEELCSGCAVARFRDEPLEWGVLYSGPGAVHDGVTFRRRDGP